MFNKIIYTIIAVAGVGLADSTFLTVKHYQGSINCSVISGCQEVLNSSYSEIMGIPLALMGAAYYLFIILVSLFYIDTSHKLALNILKYLPSFGFIFSMWLVYLQIFEIGSICQYCMLSALGSTIIFAMSLLLIKKTKTKINA